MKLDWSFFHSKFARRLFYLFVISALIPIIFLAIFQISQMSRQLSDSSQIQVRQTVKTIGMDLIGRLFHRENQLNLVGKAIKTLPPQSPMEASGNIKELAPDFEALTLVTKDRPSEVIKGQLLKMPTALPTIPIGRTWVMVKQNEQPLNLNNIILVHRLDKDDYLLGQVGNIWSFDIHSNALFWVIGPNNQLIYSNTSNRYPSLILQYKNEKDSDVFPLNIENEEYYVGYWSLFLKQRLQSENWLVVLAEPKTSVLSQAKNLYSIFIPTIIFALLLTMFLSQAQIRRMLVPLEKLRVATRKIGKRDFTTPVKVTSDDEFAELGEAFNAMASRLNHQFKALSILSVLDKSVLAQNDGEAVLNIIFEHLKEVVNYDVLVLGLLKHEDDQAISFTIDDRTHDQIEIAESYVSEEDFLYLKNNKEIHYELGKQSLPDYLVGLKNHLMNYFIVFPILHRGMPTAIIGLGFKNKKDLNTFSNVELQDIFYRASVAFTHAEWEERLFKQAHFDDLTNLPNRLMLRDEMSSALDRAENNGTHCVLMFLDLDNFKDVNDTLGHSVGDKFLAMVANRMQNSLGTAGILARIGGDEFTFLMADLASASIAKRQAEEAANALLRSFDKPFTLQDMEYFASASIGIALFPDDCKTSDGLLKYADMSMYRAKERGKNGYAFFSRELEQSVIEHNELLQEMHLALNEKEFLIYFQPKINCKTGKLVGVEALIRWQHPTRGLLQPDAFLPLAENSNLIFPIGDFVIRETCRQLQQWKKEGLNIPCSAINIAARQFTQRDLGYRIIKIIKRMGIDPNMLEFEVTESAFIESFNETNAILTQLKQLGCRLTIDDFGTGYSSMHYLMKLPLDTMKIDRVFIQTLPDDKKNISIIKAIKTLADNLGMKIVAEGIETKEQSDLLAKMGCEIQQGYYFSRPLSGEEFAKQYLVPYTK